MQQLVRIMPNLLRCDTKRFIVPEENDCKSVKY